MIKQFFRLTDGTRTGTSTLDQSEPEFNGNEGVLYISQSFSTGASPTSGLVSCLGHSLERYQLSAEMNSVYFTAPTDRAVV